MSYRWLVLVSMGVCLALVVFGLQVALSGFNLDVQPAKPVYLFHVDSNAPGELRVELLGQTGTLSWPPDKKVLTVPDGHLDIENQWRKITGNVQEYARSLYGSLKQLVDSQTD